MAIDASDLSENQANGGPSNPSHEPNQSPSNSDNPDRTFAELCDNPPPELAVDPDCLPEAVVTHANVNAHANENENESESQVKEEDGDNDNASTRPVIQPDFRDLRGPAIVYAEPDRSWIAKHKTWVITGLIVAVIIMIGVTVGVVEIERARNGLGTGGAATSTSAMPVSSSPTSVITGTKSSIGATSTSSSIGSAVSSPMKNNTTSLTSPTSVSSPVSPSQSPTPTPSACTDTSNFLTKVSWMGIADATGSWSVSYASTTDATSCCTYCYQSTSKGCDAWAWMPDDSSGSTITACNIISGWNGTDSDDTCPSGYTSVHFVQAGTNASHVGAAGPCASVASTS